MADFAQKNADVMARFRRGLYEAAAYANAHPAEIAPILAKYSGFEEKTVAAMVTTPIGTSPKQLDPRMIQPIIDAAYKYKALPSNFSARDILDPNALA
jgi:ABC-type nitrate/sulfonate/bicarbonate transport system substrate-binding protein